MPLDSSMDEAQVRLRARAMFLSFGERIVIVLRRLAGEDGAGLAVAARDIIACDDISPHSWPLHEIREILANQAQPADRAVDRLLQTVDSLLDDIAQLPVPDDVSWEFETDGEAQEVGMT